MGRLRHRYMFSNTTIVQENHRLEEIVEHSGLAELAGCFR